MAKKAKTAKPEIIRELWDQHGKEVQVVYEIKLSYVVSTGCPITDDAAAVALVQERIDAAQGVEDQDIDEIKLISVERV